MTPERWQLAESLARAALERLPAERHAFLAEGSAGDEELRRGADSLLSFYARAEAEDSARRAPGESTDGMLRTVPIESLAGRTLGQYRVEREIGRGGMGEVYLARDTRLDRPVALKLLPSFLTSDPGRVRRFEREARAASSLNHPNIVTVHEFGESDGLRFIVAEYIEGRTLRELIGAGGVKLGQALDAAIQIASALAAAHRVGVVHRDVKPENVMVREDGYVKVLDFGLAKPAAHRQPSPPGRPGDTAPTVLITDPGVIMGTVSYMSPEQARGEDVDPRSDIFSLGVVLYELVTGHRPFDGETVSHTIVAITEREPEPLSRFAPDTPAELQQIVSKALRKERAERHQTMEEMLAELREVREEVTFLARQELHLSSGGASASSREAAAQGGAGRGPVRAALWAAALLFAVAALALGAFQFVRPGREAPPPSVKMNRITANGKVWTAAVSRDGRHVAYAAGPDRQQGLWVMQTGTGSGVQIVPPADEVSYEGVTISPDGDYVYYVRKVGNSPSELYRVPTLGGTPKRLLADLATAVDFSPDGRQIAFVRHVFRSEPLTESKLMVANADGTGERVLAARKSPGYYGVAMRWRVAWSPDGEYIACPAADGNYAGELKIELVAVSLKDGSERPLTRQKWYHIKQVAWLGDNSGLIVVGRMQATAVAQVWHLSYPGGELRRLSNDFSVYDDVSVTADSSTIVTVQRDRLSNIWVAPDADAARARQISDSREDGFQGIAWTPDGRVVFSSKVGSNTNLWVMDADGGNRKRLTDSEASDAYPSVSPDGRQVVFESSRGGAVSSSIWRVDIEGGNPVRLTEGNGAGLAHCSPDGRWVYYSDAGPGEDVRSTWRVPAEGGNPERVLDRLSALMGISPDGKWLAYSYFDTQAKPQTGVAVAPIGGGPPVKLFDISAERLVRWTPDGRGLAYIDHRNQNVWAQPVEGGPPRQLTDFKTDQTFAFAWSRDGRQLALARGTLTSDVVMITDFK